MKSACVTWMISWLAVTVNNKCLLSICWLPKLHVSLAKNTFINEAQKCSLKPLSKSITSVIKLMFKQTQSYISKVYSFQVLSNSGESSLINTTWKVSVFRVFQVRIFSHSDWIRRDNPYLSVFGLNMERFELWMRENTDLKVTEYGHFSHSEICHWYY